jgi:phage/plasmid-associated DNA primase
VNEEVRVSLKPIPTNDELFDQLRALTSANTGDWDVIDEHWKEQLDLIMQARPGICRGREDRLYAGIVALENTAYADYQRPVREIFKHDRAGMYWFFNPKVLRWEKDTEMGRNELLHVISTVLSRRLSDFDTTFGEHGGEVVIHRSPPEVLNGAPLLERVEKMLRAPLRDRCFELDGEDTRRYLQFTNGVFDRDTMTFVENVPEIRVTNCTGWAWKGSGLSAETEDAVTRALESVAGDEAQENATLSTESCQQLDALCDQVPDLEYIKSLCGTWERAIYCLKHLARATFALKYQDVLWSRGPGGNGKDVLANRVATLLGTYFVNLACEALTNCRDLDSPSQTILGLRSKRFVCVREIAKDSTIRGHIYRTISDPKNKVKARGLYGKDQEFHPHYLLFACTNVPIEIDDKGGGSQRRTRILDMPYNFVDEPMAPNERQKKPDIEDTFDQHNPSFFFLMMQILRTLLTKPSNHVTPVPDEVQDAGAEELEEPWEENLKAFVEKHMTPTDKATHANTAAEVRDEFFKAAGGAVKQREVRLKLARKGFHETTQAVREGLKKSTKRLYQYKFGDDVQYVQLRNK